MLNVLKQQNKRPANRTKNSTRKDDYSGESKEEGEKVQGAGYNGLNLFGTLQCGMSNKSD